MERVKKDESRSQGQGEGEGARRRKEDFPVYKTCLTAESHNILSITNFIDSIYFTAP